MKRVHIVLFILIACVGNAQETLPHGSSPDPIIFKHFPSRMHVFIWRNWNLVSSERLGATIGCSAEEIEKVALSMGLEKDLQWDAISTQQLYITIIRRNWHLLPYEQLMSILEMDEAELNFALKEDDFLYYKLGSLKPNASRLEYHLPTPTEEQSAIKIKKIVQENFPKTNQLGEPRYGFLKELEHVIPYHPERNNDGLRFIYSYFGAFGDPLLNAETNPYPEGLLSQLANQGVNGIWLHVVLHQLSPENPDFPEFGIGSEKRLSELAKIVERAGKYGIKVYLYMNEPRAMPLSFFDERKDLQGVTSGDLATMCTSTDEVKEWIKSSLKHVFTEVNDLGGVFTITASENLTNCASHGLQSQCIRCSELGYSSVIANINKTIADGVHAGNPGAKVIAWDWGWNGHGDGREIIKKLDKDLWFMSVSEWAKPINRGNIASSVGEYSISAIGPGPRAKMHWKEAQEKEMRTVAKVQFNNTWEISSVPWIPVLDLIAEHASNLAKSEVDGYMLSWSLGGYPSPNLEIANQFSKNPNALVENVLNNIAGVRYGNENIAKARFAWKQFSDAFREFPYHINVLYYAPQQYGPANLLFAEPSGYNSTMVCFPYDNLDAWRGPYPRDVFYDQFKKMTEKWSLGIEAFEDLLMTVPTSKRALAQADYGIAKACMLHFASVANQIKFIELRDQNVELINEQDRLAMLEILKSEIELAKALYKVTANDSRIGFEASNQYFYLPQDLMEKVINCRYLEEEISQ
ncbi:hypothetical protein [Portibacter lacus]|uniref:Uncharacterized protein n=1 Tax=Portibacter lacus TaxID=1099794 RepID=A0AA37SND1_9BACT|nr:hypothetical protein [Portibacter lacus]GLR16982.1 hypothetical protein GCM10007940_15970 [Portibacter lacus]